MQYVFLLGCLVSGPPWRLLKEKPNYSTKLLWKSRKIKLSLALSTNWSPRKQASVTPLSKLRTLRAILSISGSSREEDRPHTLYNAGITFVLCPENDSRISGKYFSLLPWNVGVRALKTVIVEKKRKLWQVKVGHTELTIECLTQGLQTGSSVIFFPNWSWALRIHSSVRGFN